MSQSLYMQLTKNSYYYLKVKKAKQKERSATFKNERRKRYHIMRKNELWKDMALDAFKRRCQESLQLVFVHNYWCSNNVRSPYLFDPCPPKVLKTIMVKLGHYCNTWGFHRVSKLSHSPFPDLVHPLSTL